MKAMRAFQATVDELSKKCPPPKARSTEGAARAVPPPTVPTGHGTVATSTPSMRYQDLAQGLLCMHQLILCTMHDVLSEPPAVTEVLRSCSFCFHSTVCIFSQCFLTLNRAVFPEASWPEIPLGAKCHRLIDRCFYSAVQLDESGLPRRCVILRNFVQNGQFERHMGRWGAGNSGAVSYTHLTLPTTPYV